MPIKTKKKSRDVQVVPPVLESLDKPLFLEEALYQNGKPADFIVRGPFLSPSGYSEISRNLILGLYKLGLNFKLVIDYWWDGVSMGLETPFVRLIQFLTRKRSKPNCPIIHLSTPNNFDTHYSGYYIGYTMFEAEGVPKDWVGPCNAINELLVPTEYNVKYFKEGGIERVESLPIGINTKKYNPKVDKLSIANAKGFKFLAVSQYTARKGFDKLLTAYLRAFTNKDDVSLIIKSYATDTSERSKEYIREEVQKIVNYVKLTDNRDISTMPHILLYMDLITMDYMPALYNMCDAYVLATRGEGIHLGALQAGACEKPVITTRGTSHLAFLNDYNSYLVDSKHVVYEQVGLEQPFYQGFKVVDPNERHLEKLLKEVYINKNKFKDKAKKLKFKICKEWDYIVTAKLWKKHLEERGLI